MESLEMSQAELAIRLGFTAQSLNRTFKGEQPISYEIANKIENVTEVPANMWNTLETNYREQLVKIMAQEISCEPSNKGTFDNQKF